MKLIFITFLFYTISYGQTIEMGPLYSNPNIGIKSKSQLKSSVSIDSTFIYYSDTLALPFFDEFSKNKFQQYPDDYNAPGVTSQLYYYLLDTLDQPLPINKEFTDQQTFTRIFDIVSNTYVDSLHDTILINVSDFSQYPVTHSIQNVFPPYYIYDTIGIPDISDTVWITNPSFTQDSARIFFSSINDPTKLWVDDYAYHNYRYAINPWSLGVVTFDGLDRYGYPYQIGTSVTDYADVLTSKKIDLSSISLSDSLYFSFLYQAKGLGDEPESSDSLILEFYAPDSDEWIHIWSVEGSDMSDFKATHLPILDLKYFKDAFQFRFKNYGALSGGLDHFHVDYVYLRKNSFVADTLFKDFAFSYPINSLLKDFTSVPWDHYKNSSLNNMTDSLFINVHNASEVQENYQDGKVEVYKNGSFRGDFVLPGFDLANQSINYPALSTIVSSHDLSSGYEYEKTESGPFQEFEVVTSATAQFPNLASNDSTVFYQKFQNYYSYDDGSAEAAFGPTGSQSRLAIKYDTYEADSLIGISMHFSPSVNDVSSDLFLITVWEDDNGLPGDVLYEDDIFFPRSPIYRNGLNLFYTYYFKDTVKVSVSNSFFVGWRQLDVNRLNLGLDRNIDHSDKILYSVNGGFDWFSSPFSGSPMLRPVFSTSLDDQLNSSEISQNQKITFYPNPTDGKLSIVSESDLSSNKVTLFSYAGQELAIFNVNSIDLSPFSSGIYFLKIEGQSVFYKILKK